MAPLLSATRRRDSCWIMASTCARSSTSTTRQRLVFVSGRVSITRTLSPTLTSLVSSWAYSFLVCRTNLLYLGWRTRSMTATTAVLSIPSDTTTPSRTLRRARASAVGAAASLRWRRRGALGGRRLVGVSVAHVAHRPAGRLDLALADEGVDAGDLAAHLRDLGGVVELAGGVAEAQVERLLLGRAQLVDESPRSSSVRSVVSCAATQNTSSRVMTRALIGSFWIALSGRRGPAPRWGTRARTGPGRA